MVEKCSEKIRDITEAKVLWNVLNENVNGDQMVNGETFRETIDLLYLWNWSEVWSSRIGRRLGIGITGRSSIGDVSG